MGRKQAIDFRDVEMQPIREGENDLEVEVKTKHGVADLTIDLSQEECVNLRAVLPSWGEYKSKIDSWANNIRDHESAEGRQSMLRLAAAFVVLCFEKENRKRN